MTPPEGRNTGTNRKEWQVVKVTGIGSGELWFDKVKGGLSRTRAQSKAGGTDEYIAIPEAGDMPEDWGQQWLDGELEDDPYAE